MMKKSQSCPPSWYNERRDRCDTSANGLRNMDTAATEQKKSDRTLSLTVLTLRTLQHPIESKRMCRSSKVIIRGPDVSAALAGPRR